MQCIRLFKKSYPNPQCWTSHLIYREQDRVALFVVQHNVVADT
jgi:hypothetical protein